MSNVEIVGADGKKPKKEHSSIWLARVGKLEMVFVINITQ